MKNIIPQDPAVLVRKELPEALKDLRPYALKMAGVQDADDLLQSVAMRAMLGAHLFTPGTNFAAWLTVVLRNEFRDHCRRAKYRRVSDIDGVSEHYLAKPGNQETVVMLNEVVAAVTRLKPTFREAIAACFEDDTVNLPGAARSRLFHARNALKEMVA